MSKDFSDDLRQQSCALVLGVDLETINNVTVQRIPDRRSSAAEGVVDKMNSGCRSHDVGLRSI